MSTEPQPQEKSQSSSGTDSKWDKLLRNWAYTRLGHEGMMLDRIDRQGRIVEVLARNTATGDLSDMQGWPEGDDMGVNIGNEIHYHNTQSPQLAPQPIETPTPPTQQPAPSPAAKLWPWALAAAAGLAGFGLPYVFTRPDPPPAAEVEFPPFPAIPQYDVERWEGPGN